MNKTFRLQYVFDPLCGWCYASAPALAGLAGTWPEHLELVPSGLFSTDGGRAMTPSWIEHAWSNDQRIAAMTGQVFSEAYHQKVLLGGAVRFDSTMLYRALTAIQQVDAALEPQLLHHLQTARYVEGRDTSAADVVANVTVAFATRAGLPWQARGFVGRLLADTALRDATDARIQEAQALMQRLNIHGVPHLLVNVEDHLTVIDGASLYHGAGKLVAEVRGLLAASASADPAHATPVASVAR